MLSSLSLLKHRYYFSQILYKVHNWEISKALLSLANWSQPMIWKKKKNQVGKLTGRQTSELLESWVCKGILCTHLLAQLLFHSVCEVGGCRVWFYTSLNKVSTIQSDPIANHLFLLWPCAKTYGLVLKKPGPSGKQFLVLKKTNKQMNIPSIKKKIKKISTLVVC